MNDREAAVSTQSSQAVLPFVRDALTSSNVGTWDYDLQRRLIFCDPVMSEMYGLTAEEGERGASPDCFSAVIHPADRERFGAKRRSMTENGGLFVIEYRTVVRARVRWVLSRGRYDRDGTGQVVRGRGIAIDVTDGKQDGYADGLAFFTSTEVDPIALGSNALERAAEHALAARSAIDALGMRGLSLRADIDALLLRLGRQLAKSGWGHGR